MNRVGRSRLAPVGTRRSTAGVRRTSIQSLPRESQEPQRTGRRGNGWRELGGSETLRSLALPPGSLEEKS